MTGAYNNFKTFMLLAALTALFVGAGMLVGGRTGMYWAAGLAVAMNLGSYWFSDKIALAMSHAREVSQNEAPGLHSIIGELANRAGLPMPRVYIIAEAQPNAFATGRGPRHAAVAVTEGLLRLLDREELRGVLAHELAHVKNRDILISSVAAMLAGALTQLANFLQFGMLFGNREEGGHTNPVALIAMIVVAPFAAMLVQMAVSRSREFEADRTGAQISGQPLALAKALLKLEQGAAMIPLDANPATAHMYIVNPLAGTEAFANLFRTHPVTAERVRRLRALASPRSAGYISH